MLLPFSRQFNRCIPARIRVVAQTFFQIAKHQMNLAVLRSP
jgi:hypothetical protein